MSAVAAQNPQLGQAMMWAYGGGGVQNAFVRGFQYAASRGIASVADRLGLTLQELNLLLAMNSKLRLTIAGSPNTDKIGGFFNREHAPRLGGIWDVNDTLLNAQGLLDAVALQAISSGLEVGYSLGAARANILKGLGLIDNAKLESLPIFAFPFSGTSGSCFNLDPICGGGLFTAFRPGIIPRASPSLWNPFANHSWRAYSTPGN